MSAFFDRFINYINLLFAHKKKQKAWGVPIRPTPLTAFVPISLVELIPHKRVITVRAICSLS